MTEHKEQFPLIPPGREPDPSERQRLRRTLDEISASDDEEMSGILRSRLADQQDTGFGPGFADRVMARVRQEDAPGREPIFGSLNRQFRPFAIAASVLALLLLSLNFIERGEISVNSALGIEEISSADAFDPYNDYFGD